MKSVLSKVLKNILAFVLAVCVAFCATVSVSAEDTSALKEKKEKIQQEIDKAQKEIDKRADKFADKSLNLRVFHFAVASLLPRAQGHPCHHADHLRLPRAAKKGQLPAAEACWIQ